MEGGESGVELGGGERGVEDGASREQRRGRWKRSRQFGRLRVPRMRLLHNYYITIYTCLHSLVEE